MITGNKSGEKRLLFVLCLGLLTGSAGCSVKIKPTASPGTGMNLLPKTEGPVRVSAEASDAAEPAIASGRDGTAYIAWVAHHAGGGADVMLAHLNPAGEPQGAPVRVNAAAGQATAWRGDPPTVAVASDGAVYVGWTARVAPESAHATNIFLSVSRDEGKRFDSPVKINDDLRPADHGMHSLAVAPEGRIYLAWLDERNIIQPTSSSMAEGHHTESNRELLFSSSMDGGRTFAPNQKVATDVCPCCKTALAVGSDGHIYLSWRQVLPGDYRHIAVSSSTDGKTFAKPVIVSDDQWVLKGCPVSGASLTVSSEGTLRVLWYSAGTAGSAGVYWSESRDGGRTFSPREQVMVGQVRGTPVLLSGMNPTPDTVTAVWQDERMPLSLSWARVRPNEHSSMNSAMTEKVESPAAAVVNKRLLIAYVSNGKDKRAVWLTSADLIF